MATQVQFRRGTTTQNNAFTGAVGELTYDTEVKTLRIHDGSTAGGGSIALTTNATQTVLNKTLSTGSNWNGNPVTLQYGGTGGPINPVAGAVAYGTSTGIQLSAAGTSGQVLISGGTSGPSWINSTGLQTGTSVNSTFATNVAGGSAGQLVIQQDSSLTTFITAGAAGTFLKSEGAGYAPSWSAGQVTYGSTTVAFGNTSTSIAGLSAIDSTVGATSFFASATSPVLFAAGTVISIGNDTNATLTLRPGTIVGANTTQNLFNTVATTLNLGGAATSVNIGNATSATLTLRPGTIVGANTTQNVFNTVATTVNAFGAATAISLGNSLASTLTLNPGTLVGANTTQNVFNTVATTLNLGGAATAVNIGAATGTLTINNAQTVFNSTASVQLPVGTTAQRPGSPVAGQVRYNSTISSFEGYASGAWSSLGGVKSVDAFTYILAETSAGASNGDLDFYAENSAGTGTIQVGQWNRTNLKDYTGTLVGTQTTQNVFNATATTVNAFGAATALTIGGTTGTATLRNTTVAITNNATIGGTLAVTGTSSHTGNSTFSGTLGVTGATTLSSTLGVTGATTLSSTLGVTGITSITNNTQSSATNNGALVVTGGAGIGGHLYVGGTVNIAGNLTVTGTTTTTNSQSLTVTTPQLFLASDNAANATDIGIIGAYVSSGSKRTGLVKQASSNEWRLFSNTTANPGTTYDFTGAVYDNLRLGGIIGTGNSTIGGTLGVTGVTTLSSTLSVSGLITSTSGISGGPATHTTGSFSSTLGVTGATTLSSTLGVTGLITSTAGISGGPATHTTGSFSSTLAVTGLITATGGLSGATAGTHTGPVVGNVTGNLTGNADTASRWATARTLSFTGDATGSMSVDGTAAASTALTLAASGVSAGSYGSTTAVPVITVDAKGRVTSVSTAAISATASSVSINYSNDSNSTYQMIWGSGNALYGTAGIYCNPSTDVLFASGFQVASDLRLKSNVQDSNYGLSEVLQLRSVQYDKNDNHEIGLIAQEVETVLPEFVKEGHDGIKTVNYSQMVSVLIKAVQELSAEVNALKAKLGE
jgi:hypothetical protein